MRHLITLRDIDEVPKLIRVGGAGGRGLVSAADPRRCRCCGPGGSQGPCRGCCTEAQRPGCTSRDIVGFWRTPVEFEDFGTFEEWVPCCYKKECTRVRALRAFAGGQRFCLSTGRLQPWRQWVSEDEVNGPGGLTLRTVVTEVHEGCFPLTTQVTSVSNPNPGTGLCGLPRPWRVPVSSPGELISQEGAAGSDCTTFSGYLLRTSREFFPTLGQFATIDRVWNTREVIGTNAAACQGCEQPPGSVPKCFPAVDRCCDVAQGACFDALRPVIGGVVQGPGSGCARYGGVPIADCRQCSGSGAGACCRDGYCMRLTPDGCARVGGSFGGSGSVCRSGLCSAPDGGGGGGSSGVPGFRSSEVGGLEVAKFVAHRELWDSTLEVGRVGGRGLIVPRREVIRVGSGAVGGAGGVGGVGGGCAGCRAADLERW